MALVLQELLRNLCCKLVKLDGLGVLEGALAHGVLVEEYDAAVLVGLHLGDRLLDIEVESGVEGAAVHLWVAS